MASLDSRTGVTNDIYETNECLIITHESDDSVSYGELIITIHQKVKSDANALGLEDILLIGGAWAKPIPPAQPVKKKEIVMTLAERYYILILQLIIMEIDTQVFELNRQVEAMYDQLDNLI